VVGEVAGEVAVVAEGQDTNTPCDACVVGLLKCHLIPILRVETGRTTTVQAVTHHVTPGQIQPVVSIMYK
jgi:hypothetical protein